VLFNSPEFLFCFLPLTFAGFLLLGRIGRSAVLVWLALMSLVFYGYWRPSFVAVLCGSILFNFICSKFIWRYRNRPKLQNAVMVFGIVANLGMLAFFKYLFPALDFIDRHLGLHANFGSVVLPLGISFFTFTQIAYLVDLSQESADPQDFIGYAVFVTFFPHLIAGPIIHHREIMPQIAKRDRYSLNWRHLATGASWFILGLAKKVIIADRLAPYAESAFTNAAGLTMTSAWIGLLCYSLQLYFDFSGYSDMAIALAKMFSIDFPLNFDSPYKARNIIDFWSRWHMTLTRYLTMYLYNPISMYISRRRIAANKSNSKKALRTPSGFGSVIATPLLITMTLAGIWHGAGIQFVIFGVLHGFYLTLNHAWRIFRTPGNPLDRLLALPVVSVMLTYLAVLVGQVFFRASSTSDAVMILRALVGLRGVGLESLRSEPIHAFFFILLLPVIWFFPNTQEIMGYVKSVRPNLLSKARLDSWKPNWLWAVSLSATTIVAFWYMTDTSSFLYFQF
jgi:alginate O-acetyltransferase complex protein AlgI